MELIRGQHNIQPRHHGCVATIGNFDGVHLGHQAILGQLADKAADLGLPTLIITFEPQPQEYFAPAKTPARLTRLREKLLVLEALGVDRILCLRFDRRLAALSAQDFIQQLLVQGLGVRYLVVGDDFRFGHARQGDFALLMQAGQEFGFQVEHTPTVVLGQERVSSTRLRSALAQPDLDLASRLLGRPYRVCGRVAHGDKRGRTIGFPTANVHLHREVMPLSGVYAVWLHGIGPQPRPGMANIGRRPTVDGVRELLEVHLFDFQQDIYGCAVSVDFLKHLRAERRFESLDALCQQLEQDARQALAFFQDHGSSDES